MNRIIPLVLAIALFMEQMDSNVISTSLPAFVIARFLQGMGGAMMTPVGRLVLIRSTPRNELVSAMAWLTIPAMVGPLVGPPVGGFITTFLTWHWIFLINVPIGMIGIWFATHFLPDNEERIIKRLDWPGFFLSGFAMSGAWCSAFLWSAFRLCRP